MNRSAGHRDIVFIVDEQGLAANDRVIDSHGGQCLNLSQLRSEDLEGHRFVAIDVDLTIAGNVQTLRAALAGRRSGYFQFHAIDLSSRLETVYANIVGATEIVRRPFSAADLESRYDRFAAPVEAVAPPAMLREQSVSAAAAAFGDMFDALVAGRALDAAAVAMAGSLVADAIGEGGFADWVDAVRRHHQGTFQHCLIVTGLASTFSRSMGMSRRDILTVTTAGMLHDIGKAAVPVSILDKPGKLSPAELTQLRIHPEEGYRYLLGQSRFDDDTLAAVRFHHEYLDGSGYPDGLSASAVGDLTRIVTICDVFGAMIEQRAYKPAATHAEAMAVLDDMVADGKLESPLVRAFHLALAA